jgi:SAM-dependent methyltransferase
VDARVKALEERAGGYDEASFAKLFAVEDRHFWFRARNVLIEGIAARALSAIEAPAILEIGCGNGNVLGALARACENGRVIGLDFKAQALAHARRRSSLMLVQADATRTPFSIPFDLVGMFDVLEHIQDDSATLRSAHGLLRPGGKLLITVPALMDLWSYADLAAKHCRRYELAELTGKLKSTGFEVEFVSPFMTILYPAMRLWRFLNRGGSETDTERFERDLQIVPIVNDAAAWLMSSEARWVAAGHRLPFGASLVALAVKSGGR